MQNPSNNELPMRNDYISQLAKFLESDVILNLSLEERGYASLKEANDLVFENPLAFVFGLIFDQSMKSSVAWQSPFFLKKRLGHLDMQRIAAMDEDQLRSIIAQKRALHRYPGKIAKHIVSTCKTLASKFSGEALNLWKDQRRFLDVKENFLSLKGIGEKKASLAVLMLARDFHVCFDDLENLPLAIDVHLRRVLNRSGFFDTESREGLQELHENLKDQYHRFPALFGTAAWFIGRHYCHETSPVCDSCPLAPHCLKRISHE